MSLLLIAKRIMQKNGSVLDHVPTEAIESAEIKKISEMTESKIVMLTGRRIELTFSNIFGYSDPRRVTLSFKYLQIQIKAT